MLWLQIDRSTRRLAHGVFKLATSSQSAYKTAWTARSEEVRRSRVSQSNAPVRRNLVTYAGPSWLTAWLAVALPFTFIRPRRIFAMGPALHSARAAVNLASGGNFRRWLRECLALGLTAV